MRKKLRVICTVLALSLTFVQTSYGAFQAPPHPWGPSYQGEGYDIAGQTGTSSQVKQPEIAAEGAVLFNANTGEFLFGKNEYQRFYPASTTKLMTALLVAENCGLDETVTFSESATTNLEAGSVTLNLTAGDQLTVRQCLYGLMLRSANEVANGLAEHMAGSVSKFAIRMNEKARALGCSDTNFVNPNGLNDSNHYTTPRDMALIARAAYDNQVVAKVSSTLTYEIPATKKAQARIITMGHKMLFPKDSRYYEGVTGGKTGYTSKAGNTLVTCAEKDGVRLIAVIMKAKQTHYTDTKALLDYGFQVVKTGNAGSPSGDTSGPGNTADSGNTAPFVSQTGWKKDNGGWRYVKQDGKTASNEWLTINGEEYWFDSNQYMATGWRQFVGEIWYYFHSDGKLAKGQWISTNGKSFYVGNDGAMLKNTRTPDGYYVNESGVWIP